MKLKKLLQSAALTLLISATLVGCDLLGGGSKKLSAEDAAHYQESLDLFYQNYNEEGLLKINQLIEDYPEHADSLALRAVFLLRMEEFDNAKADIDRIFELDEESALGYAARSWYAENVEEDYDKAMADILKALELNPELALAYAQRGSLAIRFPGEGNSFEDYGKAAELEPDYVAAHANLAIDYMDRQDYESAIKELDIATGVNPDSDYLYSLRGLIFLYQDNFEQAIINYDKAIELGFIDKQAFFYRGVALYFSGEYARARADFDTAEEMGVGNEYLFTFRAICRSFEGDYVGAAEDFEHALSINPNIPDSLNGAAFMYAVEETSLDKALEYAEKAIELNPDNQNYQFTQGLVYTKMGEYELALPIFTQLIDSGYAYANYGLGVLYELQGNTEEAIAAYVAFIEAMPQDFMAGDAGARLEALGAEQP